MPLNITTAPKMYNLDEKKIILLKKYHLEEPDLLDDKSKIKIFKNQFNFFNNNDIFKYYFMYKQKNDISVYIGIIFENFALIIAKNNTIISMLHVLSNNHEQLLFDIYRTNCIYFHKCDDKFIISMESNHDIIIVIEPVKI
jgi:hypothetical protein